MEGYVYILQDDNGRFYIGSTTNLERRLAQHTLKTTWTTARMKNARLVLTQGYPTILEARRIERRIKKLKRKDYIQKMVDDGYIKLCI